MLVIVLLSFATLLGAWALLWMHGRRMRALTRHLPGFPQLPLIGNVHQILGDSLHLYSFVTKASKMMDDANAPFIGWLGPCPFIMVSNPEDIKAVTNTFIEKPYFYSFAPEYVGNGLVTAPGHIWKRSIKKLGGTFTGSVVEGYQEVFNAQAQRLVQELRGEVGKEPFDAMKKYIAFTTLESICQTAFGISSRVSVVTIEFYAAYIRVFELLAMRLNNMFLHLDCIYRLSWNYREMMKSVTVLHAASNKIMKARRTERKELKQRSLNSEVSVETDKTKPKAFLDILLDLQDIDPTLTDDQIRSEMSTIIVGGLMLGCKPDIQERLYTEMEEIFGNSKRAVEKEDLVKMKYCEALLCETMRMFPPIPVVGRLADRDLQLTPLICYLIVGFLIIAYYYVYIISAAWFICGGSQESVDIISAVRIFSLGITSHIALAKLWFICVYHKNAQVVIAAYLACNADVVSGSRFSKNMNATLRIVKRRALIFGFVIMSNAGIYLAMPLLRKGRHMPDDTFVFFGLEPMFESPNYEIAMIFNAAAIFATGYIPTPISAFFFIVCGYTEAYMLALGKELETIWEEAEEYYKNNISEIYIKINLYRSKDIDYYVQKRLETIIKGHKNNINLITKVEELFRVSIAIELLSLIIGLIADLLGGLENTLIQIPYSLFLVGMDCLAGQRLMEANLIFERAVYACNWENFNPSNRKRVLVLLMNSQKTMSLSAGALAPLSFETMMNIIKSIYSAYTALHSTMK